MGKIDYSFYNQGVTQSSDFLSAVNQGLQVGNNIRKIRQQKMAEKAARQDEIESDAAYNAYMQDPNNQENMMNLYKADSKLATGVFSIVKAGDQEAAAEVAGRTKVANDTYTSIHALLERGEQDAAREVILGSQEKFASAGIPTDKLLKLANSQSIEEAMSISQSMKVMTGSTIKALEPLTRQQQVTNALNERKQDEVEANNDVDQALAQKKFAETQRNNQVNNNISYGNLAINKQKQAAVERQLQADVEAGKVSGGKVGSVSPKDFTVKSLAAYQESGNVADLERYRSGSEKRNQLTIDGGLAAAQSLPVINRSIDLLDSIKTGGFANAQLKVKKTLGIEGADEAELSHNMGKAVLSQLKATFGSAFTVEEGKRLEVLEAGLGKSVAGNRRILEQARRIAEVKINQAKKRAEQIGDTLTIDEMNDYMNVDLDTEESVLSGTPAPSGDSSGLDRAALDKKYGL